MTCKIDLLRHAESMYNKYHLQEYDVELTMNGKLSANRLKGHYQLVICSSLKRARQTLDYSHITYDKLIVSDLIREKKTVIGDHFHYEELTQESYRDMYERIDKFRDILNEYAKIYNSILVVSHGIFLSKFAKRKFNHCEIINYLELNPC
jgi:broad specificity phosphatase PhoE